MAFRIRIDRLEANIEEITVGAWRKAPGDRVAVGDPVVEIITDKITFEYESEAEGVLRVIVAPEKSVVPVHYVIGVIASPEESLPDYEAENASLLARLGQGVNVHEAAGLARPDGAAGAPGGERTRATPAARRRARELEVDLAEVARHVEGAVQATDVERFHAGELP